MGITWDDDGFTDAIMSISADSDDHSEGVEDMQETCWCNKYCNKWLWGLSLKKPENIGRCCRIFFFQFDESIAFEAFWGNAFNWDF